VSLVIPVFNESDNVDALVARLRPVMDDLQKSRSVEVIFVNDGSKDDSLDKLLRKRTEDPRLKVVDFNRNYGQHAAVFAGFEHASGDVVVTLDADLQNPPEEIPKLLAKIDEGYDVVGTRRLERKDSIFRKMASAIINRMSRKMVGVDSGDFGCMLRAYRRDVVDAMCQSEEISTFIPALAEIFAGRSVVIDVRHEERAAGTSKYSLWKLIRLQFDLVTSFSMAPLRLLMSVGVLVASLGFLLSAGILVARLMMTHDQWESFGQGGVFTLFAILYIFVGAQFLAFGILGEYLGRIYGEVRKRPRFVVRRFHGEDLDAKTVVPARNVPSGAASGAAKPAAPAEEPRTRP
jgi:undecaprenyl-phosphate 4-deoxy-4-formamido-L-arabinose transferase